MHQPYLSRTLLALVLAITIISCSKEIPAPVDKKPQTVNSFAMQLGGKNWEPGIIGTGPCSRTFNATWSWLDGKPFFNISAYSDPSGKTGAESENGLLIQVMDVQATGSYFLTGSYLKSFSSNAVFWTRKPDGSRARYINVETSQPFRVVFEQFTDRPNTTLKGVSGYFYGTLHNEKDPSDSVTIKKGEFVFHRTNWYDFSQCE